MKPRGIQSHDLAARIGPRLLELLNCEETEEIMVNPDGRIFQDRLGHGCQLVGQMNPWDLMEPIAYLAGLWNTVVDAENPILETTLPVEAPFHQGRFSASIPPVTQAPSINIRRPAIKVFSLQEYVDAGIMTPRQADSIRLAVGQTRNVLVSGGTKSGKSTLLNTIIGEANSVDPHCRFVTIEDTPELRVNALNKVPLKTTDTKDSTDLLKHTMRRSPGRVITGEVRGREALDLLLAWNSGHPGGAATLHANDPLGALHKLALLVGMHPHSPRNIEKLVALSVEVVIQINRHPSIGRRVDSIMRVERWNGADFDLLEME